MDSHAFDWRGYGLGELPPAEMAECERHLGSCAQCRTELSRWQATLSAVRNLPQVEPPRRIVLCPIRFCLSLGGGGCGKQVLNWVLLPPPCFRWRS